MRFAWDVAKYDNPKEFDHDVMQLIVQQKKMVLKSIQGKTFMKI